ARSADDRVARPPAKARQSPFGRLETALAWPRPMACASSRWFVSLLPFLVACNGVPLEGEPKDEEDTRVDDQDDDEASNAETSGPPASDETSLTEPTDPSTTGTTTTGTTTSTSDGDPDESGDETSMEPEEPRGPTPPRDGANFPFPQN